MTRCIICGRPRDGDYLTCNSPACADAVDALLLADVEAVRLAEAVEAMRGPGAAYVHVRPKE